MNEMNEKFNEENEEEVEETAEFSAQGEPDVAIVLKRIQQQLAFLEKKIDLLLNQSSSQPSERSFRGDRDKRFSKPFRHGGGHSRFGKRDHGDRDRGPRDRDFSQGGGEGRSFNRGEGRGFSQGGESRGFGQGGENRGFGGGPRKKPFFQRRRNRG